VLRVKTIFSYTTGAPWVCTLNFADTANQTQANNVNTAVGAFWGAVDTHINSGVTWTTDAAVQDINVLTGQIQGLFPVTPVTGTGAVATEILPVVNQGLVSWRTGQFGNGRESRGRTFIPGLTEAAATLGVVTAAVKTNTDTAAAALIADANSLLAIYQRPKPGVSGALFDVNAGTMWTKFAVLRSRRD
jgi:hypothetical protein